MRPELEKKLIERWPTWFNVEGDIHHTLMPVGFEHGDGWFDLLWKLCEDLELLVAKIEQETCVPFEVLQVKEKFGGLRIHSNHGGDAISDRIVAAQLESVQICEICGKPGKLRSGCIMKTLCGEHSSPDATERW